MSETKIVPSYVENKLALQANLSAMFSKESLDVFNIDADQLAVDYQSTLKLSKGDQAPLF